MATYRSLAELADTTQDELLPGLVNGLKENDEFTAAIVANARVTDRPTIKFNRTTDVGSAGYVGCDDTVSTAAITASAATYDLFTLNRSFEACIKGQNLYSSFTDVVESELAGALQSMSLQIASDIMTGDGSTAPSGLETEITNSFAVATSGDFDLGDMERLYDETLSRTNLVYVGAPATVRAVTKEMRSLGGFDYVTVAGTDLRVPGFLGMPILRNVNATAGELHIVDLNQFVMYVGQSEDNNVGGIFNMVPVGALENKLRKKWHLYVDWASMLIDTQGASTLTGVV